MTKPNEMKMDKKGEKKKTIAIELSKTLLQRCNNKSFKCARTLL
jgi:hypothetical protein